MTINFRQRVASRASAALLTSSNEKQQIKVTVTLIFFERLRTSLVVPFRMAGAHCGFGSVGSVVASSTRDLQFESHHQQIFHICKPADCMEKTNISKKVSPFQGLACKEVGSGSDLIIFKAEKLL